MTQHSHDASLPIRRTYAWKSQTVVDMPKGFGGERRVFHLKGSSTYEISALKDSKDHRRAALKLVDMHETFLPTQISYVPPGLSNAKTIKIPKIELTPDMVDFETSHGTIDLPTGAFTLGHTVRITSAQLPLLKQFDVTEILIVILESGRMDLSEKSKDFQAWVRFFVPPDHQGGLRFNCFGKQSSCDTETSISASLNPRAQEGYNSVYICAGEEVTLFWSSSPDVSSATISADPGTDLGEVAPSGRRTVQPHETTEYRISATGECTRDDAVVVHVWQEDEPILIAANYVRTMGCWVYQAGDDQYSRSIRITEIEPHCGLGCMVHVPRIVGHPYMVCGDVWCNGLWDVDKRDAEGVTWRFNTGNLERGALRVVTPALLPLPGQWIFAPLVESDQPSGMAMFRLWGRCG